MFLLLLHINHRTDIDAYLRAEAPAFGCPLQRRLPSRGSRSFHCAYNKTTSRQRRSSMTLLHHQGRLSVLPESSCSSLHTHCTETDVRLSTLDGMTPTGGNHLRGGNLKDRGATSGTVPKSARRLHAEVATVRV